MSVLSAVSWALFIGVCAAGLGSTTSCGTNAKGIDDCREIEEARCSAAKNCEAIDVDECRRFYRDQCLHGLSVSPPSSLVIRSCVATIRAAGLCAAEDGARAPNECDPAPSLATSAQTVCEIVSNPEKTSECSFLAPDADAGRSGGSSAAGASATGAAGASGAAGAAVE